MEESKKEKSEEKKEVKEEEKMEKKEEKPKKEEEKKEEFPEIPGITPEMKEKLKELKTKIDAFKGKVIEKFEEYIVGIALLPPKKLEGEEKIDPNKINLLVLVDDSDVRRMTREELHEKLTEIINKIASEIDPKLNPQTMLLSELKEYCYDGKYEILGLIAMSAPVHDPLDMLKAIKIAEVHKNMVLKKFEKYIVSYVAAGSLFRGEKANDIDVYVIVDDTDVKKMSRAELKDKLRAIIVGMGFEASKITGVEKSFHIQTYILTDFWDNLKDANPVIFTFLRDGVPLYDRGVFMPWKLLLQMGRVKPSPEAIDMNMELGERLLERIRAKMLSVVGEDLYYAVLNPAQAALMLYGIPPPTPKETVKLMEEIFVKKEKLLEKKYVEILEKVRSTYKKIEHGEIKEVSGKEIDDLLKDAQEYLKRIKELFKQIEERSQKESILDVYDACINITKDLLAMLGEKSVKTEELEKKFKEILVEKEKIPIRFLKVLKDVIDAKEDYLKGKLTKQELEKVKKEARNFVKTLVEHMQRKKIIELEKCKIRFKYNNKIGELTILGDMVFITVDLEKREELLKAKLGKDGALLDVEKAKLEDYEECIAKISAPPRAFIKEKTLSDLKEIVGKEIEVILR